VDEPDSEGWELMLKNNGGWSSCGRRCCSSGKGGTIALSEGVPRLFPSKFAISVGAKSKCGGE